MDNLTIQITPLEVTYQHKEPLPLSCVFKKLVIATNHPLEKYQIKSEPELAAGKNKFNNGPIFALNKEFQLQNTKISLDFISKKQRGISCIGSAVIDIATLPAQPQSLLDLNLSNCIYPQGKTKLHVKRKQESTPNRKNSKGKPQIMGILQTEGQLKQQLLLNRRADPKFPTAYEISRRNYKQAQTRCRDNHINSKQQRSGSKGSYQKRFHAANADSNSRLKNGQLRHKDESPRPRQRTPEPIVLNHRKEKSKINGQDEPSHNERIIRELIKQQQQLEEPLNLYIKPYRPDFQRQKMPTDQNVSGNISYKELQMQKNHKYLDITQKLQRIQDQIMGNQQKKCKTEILSDSIIGSESISQFNYNAKAEKDISQQSYDQFDSARNQTNTVKNSSIFNRDSPIQMTNKSQHEESISREIIVKKQNPQTQVTLSGDKSINKNTTQASPAQKNEAVTSVDFNRNNQKISQSLILSAKRQIMQFQGLNIQLSKENEMLRFKLFDAEETVKKLMRQLSEKITIIQRKDGEIIKASKEIQSMRLRGNNSETKQQQIQKLAKQIQELKARIIEQRNLIEKITRDYDQKLDQIVILEDELQSVKKSQLSSNSGVRTKNEDTIVAKLQKEIEQLRQENLKVNSRLVEAESNLKLRDNQIKHLKLENSNSIVQKKQLQEEIMVMARGKKQEMARQKSLAHIEQISNTSLAQLTKRENQNLKNQVKILQEKIGSLSGILQSLANKDEKAKKSSAIWNDLPNNNEKQRFQSKAKELQQKCRLLQDELRKKKSQLAQIVNLVFDFGDSQLMNNVERLMGI